MCRFYIDFLRPACSSVSSSLVFAACPNRLLNFSLFLSSFAVVVAFACGRRRKVIDVYEISDDDPTRLDDSFTVECMI